jgi:hypothetical protein
MLGLDRRRLPVALNRLGQTQYVVCAKKRLQLEDVDTNAMGGGVLIGQRTLHLTASSSLSGNGLCSG